MGQGILLSQEASVDFMIHGVFSYQLFGQEFWIEKKENGEWREIRSLRSRAFDALSYLLAPHSVREEVYSFSDSYGRLTSGEYRLVKELLRERSGGWESQYVAAEFAVK